jgi:ankyrin repeat protein
LGTGRRVLAHLGARLDLEGAAGVGRLDVVKRFFKRDGKLNASATRSQMEAGFMWACEYGRSSVARFLLQQGVQVDVQPHGETGLHWGAYAGHPAIVKLLLKRKASVDKKDERYGGTALGWYLDPPQKPKLHADPRMRRAIGGETTTRSRSVS